VKTKKEREKEYFRVAPETNLSGKVFVQHPFHGHENPIQVLHVLEIRDGKRVCEYIWHLGCVLILL